MHSICIIGALKDEIAGIKQRMKVEKTIDTGSGKAFVGPWLHHQIILVRSGIGQTCAGNALEAVCDRVSISQIVSIGFAGGLNPQLQIGDIVIADSVRELDPSIPSGKLGVPRTHFLPMDDIYVEKAMHLSLPFPFKKYQGGIVTVDRAICTPAEKLNLGKKYAAVAVEMETSALLRTALHKEIPFLSVRAISDTADQELVDFGHCVDEEGEVSKVKAGWHVLTHLNLIAKVVRLRTHAQSAAQNLTTFIEEYIKHAF